MSRDLAIDLGTANTLVYAKGKGLVLNEPTVVALDSRSREVLAIGTDAWQMIGRTPGYIVAERPLRGGAITDFEVTERMLSVLLHRVGVSRLNRPKVLICVPSAITAVERRAVKEAARRAGASASLPDRAADGRGDRRGPAHPRARREHGRRRRRRHGRDGGDLAGRRRRGAGTALRRLRLRRVDPELRPQQARRGHRRAHGGGREDGHRVRVAVRTASNRPRSVAARWRRAGPRR